MFLDLENRLKYKYKIYQNIEKEFLTIYRKHKDILIRDYFVLKYLDFIYDIAHKLYAKVSHVKNFEFSTLVSAGQKGIIDAIDKFDINRGTQFNTYAFFRIKGSMLDVIRHNIRHYNRHHYYSDEVLVCKSDSLCKENDDSTNQIVDDIISTEIRTILKDLPLDNQIFVRLYYFAEFSKTKVSFMMGLTTKQLNIIDINIRSILVKKLEKYKGV